MGAFLSSIFTGSNPSLDNSIGNAGSTAGFATTTGQGDTRTASNYLNDIISGDPAKISHLLAPEIGQMTGAANQKIQTEGEFGTRSGGQNAGNQATGDQTRGNIDNAISGLTGNAVSQLGQMGENLLNTGLSADQLQAQLGQMKMQNAQNSLLGGLINKGISAGFSGLTGGLGSIIGGTGSFGSGFSGGLG